MPELHEVEVTAEFTEGLLADALAAFPHVRLTVTGDCMRPTLLPGEVVLIARAAPRWGDVVLLRHPEGLRLHRLIWVLPGSSWRTKGDRSARWDPPLPPSAVLGTVIGVEGRVHARRAGLALRSLVRAALARLRDALARGVP